MNRVRASIIGAIAIVAVGLAVYATKRQEWIAIPKAREPLLSYLKDPASAQFRNERITATGALCGEVNSKNSMGGYVGFKRFILAGPEANYIEEHGALGRISDDDYVKRLGEEKKILERFIKFRKESPGFSLPTEDERRAMASKGLFEIKWKELCDVGKA